MIKTTRFFILCCLMLFACCFTAFSPSYAQNGSDEAVSELESRGLNMVGCDPLVFLQLEDIAQSKAEVEKQIMQTATDEKDDPSIMSLSCFEEDINRYLDDAERIIKDLASGGINLGSLASFFTSQKDRIGDEIRKAAGKFACENIKAFIQRQLDQCFDFRLIKNNGGGVLGNQACIISASASLAINRHGFLYTGAEFSGQVNGPGGINSSVLIGGDIMEGLNNLYDPNSWSEDDYTYLAHTNSCGTLDPAITAAYSPDYYLNLGVGEVPENVILDGNTYIYTTVGSFTLPDGTTLSYENDAFCYGFEMQMPYVPCGYEEDGVTPASCAGEPGADPSCCNIESEECDRSGLDVICPCSQGNLNDFDINPETGVAECLIGVPACCNGELNDCAAYSDEAGNLIYPYCEGTEPELPEEVDCEEVLDDLNSQLILTEDEILENCGVEFVEAFYQDKINECNQWDGAFSNSDECNSIPHCQVENSGVFIINCQIKSDVVRSLAVQACSNAAANQDIIDNFDFQDCEFDLDDLSSGNVTGSGGGGGSSGSGIGIGIGAGGGLTITTEGSDGSTGNSVLDRIIQFAPAYTPPVDTNDQNRQGSSNTPSSQSRTQAAPTPTVTPRATRTAPAPATAQPSQTPSAGTGNNTNNGGSQPSNSNGGGSILRNLF